MNFDRLAGYYRGMEAVAAGQLLHRARTAWLGEIRNARRVLIAGEGHGRGVEAVRRAAPEAEITVVELSGKMIDVAQARLTRRGVDLAGVRWIRADVRGVVLERGSHDVVVTQFFLDCFGPGDVARVVARLAEAAAPDATWLLADFQVPESGWRRLRARAILGLLYAFFRLTVRLEARRLMPPEGFLQAAGFELKDRREFSAGLLYSDRWRRG